jgi:hypothetical protein
MTAGGRPQKRELPHVNTGTSWLKFTLLEATTRVALTPLVVVLIPFITPLATTNTIRYNIPIPLGWG